MPPKEPRNLYEVSALTEEESRALLESVRWPDGLVCPHCQGNSISECKSESARPGLYRCKDCRKRFTVTTGTYMHSTKLSMKQWVMAHAMVVMQPKGIAALQLKKHLGIGSYKCALHLAHRIRKAMEYGPEAEKLDGVVEADELLLGSRGQGTGGPPGRSLTRPVMLMAVSRNGQARATVQDRARKEEVGAFLKANVAPTARLMTDYYKGYLTPGKEFASHERVCHGKGEYVRGEVSTNLAECFNSITRRALFGTFHWFSRKHGDRYAHELARRWSMRGKTLVGCLRELMKAGDGRRLTYESMVNGEA